MFILKYDEAIKTFSIEIYNTEIRKTFTRCYTVAEVSKLIIYAKAFLSLKKYRELG